MRLEQVTARALKHLKNDKYILAVAVSQRANELANGAKPLLNLDVKKVKVSEIALREISEGVLKIAEVVSTSKD